MTILELLRMTCYAIGAPVLLYLALSAWRNRLFPEALLYVSLSALFLWYIVEITIAGTGVNTREYRVVGTPLVMACTVAAVWMAVRLVRWPSDD